MRWYIGLFLIAICGCEQPTASVPEYYDLERLILDQVLAFDTMGYALAKTVAIDGNAESKTFESLDSAGWHQAFELISDFSPAKPAYVGAFEVVKEAGKTGYQLKENQKSPLKSFTIADLNNRTEISGVLFNEKSIYTDKMRLGLTLENGMISSFEVSGHQKMFMKDTVHYRISGTIISK